MAVPQQCRNTRKQKQCRMDISQEMLAKFNDEPDLLKTVITEIKAQSSQWKRKEEPRSKIARKVRSNVKFLLIVFFDCNGMMHYKFLPQGHKVNKEHHFEVMRQMREAFRQKRAGLWKNQS